MGKPVGILFLAAVIAFQLFWHFNLLFLVQGNVALYGQLINGGLTPYVDFYLHYPPGMPYLTAWLGGLDPNLLFPYHVIWVGTVALTTVLVFIASRTLFPNKKALPFLATIIFAFWHIFWAKNIFWFHTPILPLALGALILLVSKRTLRVFAGGILLAIATLFKQPAIFFFLAFLAALASGASPPRGWNKKMLVAPGIFAASYLLPLVLLLWLYVQKGEWEPFLRHVIFEGISTTNTNTFGTITFLTTGPPKNLVQFALYLFLVPYLKIVWRKLRGLAFKQESSPHLLLLAGTIGGSFFLYPHIWVQYAQMALPFLSIITAYVLITHKGYKLLGLVFLVTLLPLLSNFFPYFKQQRSSDVSYHPVVEWIQAHTQESERIFVCCTEPEIYWYAKRLPASRYTEYNGPMLATIDLNKEIVQDLEKHKPRIIVEFADNEWEQFNVVYVPKVLDYIHEHYSRKQEMLPKVYIYERK